MDLLTRFVISSPRWWGCCRNSLLFLLMTTAPAVGQWYTYTYNRRGWFYPTFCHCFWHPVQCMGWEMYYVYSWVLTLFSDNAWANIIVYVNWIVFGFNLALYNGLKLRLVDFNFALTTSAHMGHRVQLLMYSLYRCWSSQHLLPLLTDIPSSHSITFTSAACLFKIYT